jgi:predicted glycoside hydrolase/deacetylase ChbG (UPF0249 family)
MSATDRFLIVNADDFGRSAGVNAGVVECHQRGIVTSATLMVRWPDSVEAGSYAAQHVADFSVGLHFDLGEWQYADGQWSALYTVARTDDESAVATELHRQLGRFVELVGRPPTHLDSHQHVHRDPAVGRVVAEAGQRLDVPVRDQSAHITYCGMFYGQDGKGQPYPEFISVDALLSIIAGLPPGTTELGCHPALFDDVPGAYRAERLIEAEVLCDPRVRAALNRHSVSLRSFSAAFRHI